MMMRRMSRRLSSRRAERDHSERSSGEFVSANDAHVGSPTNKTRRWSWSSKAATKSQPSQRWRSSFRRSNTEKQTSPTSSKTRITISATSSNANYNRSSNFNSIEPPAAPRQQRLRARRYNRDYSVDDDSFLEMPAGSLEIPADSLGSIAVVMTIYWALSKILANYYVHLFNELILVVLSLLVFAPWILKILPSAVSFGGCGLMGTCWFGAFCPFLLPCFWIWLLGTGLEIAN